MHARENATEDFCIHVYSIKHNINISYYNHSRNSQRPPPVVSLSHKDEWIINSCTGAVHRASALYSVLCSSVIIIHGNNIVIWVRAASFAINSRIRRPLRGQWWTLFFFLPPIWSDHFKRTLRHVLRTYICTQLFRVLLVKIALDMGPRWLWLKSCLLPINYYSNTFLIIYYVCTAALYAWEMYTDDVIKHCF